MNMSARQVDEHSLWEFAAVCDGRAKANGAEDETQAPTDDEFDDALARAPAAFMN